jgi:large subunit ribosomal protein L23
MAIFDTTTKKTKAQGKKAPAEKKALTIKPSSLAHRFILRPRITEKAYALNAANQYVFEVAPSAHKTVIKRAIQEAFGVNVVDVRCINLPAKTKVFGRKGQIGTRSAVKKAIVTLAEGESIELFKAGV